MRQLIIATMLLALSCAPAMATDDSDKTESSRVYDAKGRYQGRISEKCKRKGRAFRAGIVAILGMNLDGRQDLCFIHCHV